MVRYWVVRMTDALFEEIYGIEDWEIAQKNNFVGIAWSINPIKFSEENKEIFIERFENIYSQPPGKHDISEMLRFVHDIKIDDIVILPTNPDEGIIYFIGKVKSHAYYLKKIVDKAASRTRRNVEWITSVPRKSLSSEPLKNSLHAQLTVFNIDKHEKEIEALISGKPFKKKPIVIESKTDMIGKLSEIQKRLLDISPIDFEQLVCETLNLKYDVKTVKTRDVADGGVDFVSLNDRGHIKYRGQIKRTSKNISNSEILQLRGTLSEDEEGIFITTSHFTPSSIEESNSANKKKIHMINGEQLSQIILDIYNELDDKIKKKLKIKNSHYPGMEFRGINVSA